MNARQFIKEKIDGGEWGGYSQKRIFAELGVVSQSERIEIGRMLSDMRKKFEIFFEDGKYFSAREVGLKKGVLRGNERGFAFFVADDPNCPDMFIPNRRLNGAEHKDVVLVRKVESDRGSSDEGEVVAILERGVKSLSGNLYKYKNEYYVRPDDKNFFEDVLIPRKGLFGAKSGDKVFVKITRYPDNGFIEGKVEEIFGRSFELFAEEESVIKSFGFDETFPQSVLDEVAKLPQKVENNQLIGRVDFTDRLIFTIDGEDSRDFDDAVEIEKREDGSFLLGVHIADVDEYVPLNSAVDREAFRRSTSVYFPDRVIPMLPKELSNWICSLNEGEDRLTLSCLLDIDKNGEVKDKRIVKGVIRSKRRMTYKEVQGILDGDEKFDYIPREIKDAVGIMREAQELLSAKKEKRGRVDLEARESAISIKNGEILVEPRKSLDAYKIIEEFMIAANEAVAEYAFYLELPFVYRTHEKPTDEKAENFVAFLKTIGINARWKPSEVRSSDYAAVLKKLKGEPVYSATNKIMLRSMSKAKYTVENKGHFGLSSDCYCHFTSPIRRYPDLIVHRVTKMIIDGRIGEIIDLYGGLVEEVADVSSKNERNADDAERAVDDIYSVFYMKDRVGEEYDAVVGGVTSGGIYCEMSNSIEGFVSLEDLPRGNYVYDAKTFSLSSGKRKYAVGDEVRVGVVGVDIASRKIMLILLDKVVSGEKGRKREKNSEKGKKTCRKD